MHFSADPDARWVRKCRKSTLSYKGFARSDEEGFIDKFHITPANAGGSPESGTMIDGARARRVLADKACASRANREKLTGKHRDGIMRKAARGRPLRASEKRFNRLVSKRRFRIEQCFGTMKRLFGLDRTRCFGRARTHAQMAMTAIAQNLLKAANKIILTPKALPAASLRHTYLWTRLPPGPKAMAQRHADHETAASRRGPALVTPPPGLASVG